MTQFDVLRARLATDRSALAEAEAGAGRSRWSLSQADAALTEALRLGDADAIGRAQEERRTAEQAHVEAARRFAGLRDRVLGGLADFVDQLHDQPEHVGDAVLAGVDQTLPIALLPVRLETRFSGPTGAPVLKVRIYPDDVHVDDHEPDLSEEEVDQGKTYWTAVRGGRSEAEAWAVLAGRLGPYRALWVRQCLEPTNDGSPPTFPDVQLRAPGTSRPAVARALPDLFLVRVRAGGTTTITPGKPVADTLQVGADLSASRPAPAAPAAAPAGPDDDVIVLAEDARWLSDFAAAVDVGMAVEVPLPAGTELVDEVAVTGVCVSLTPEDASALVDDLVTRHRVTHGAGFVAPGTPTNNLADTTSGWLSRPDPARLDPITGPAAEGSSNAAVLARALGLATERLAGLVGAADRDAAEAEIMASALFEATWGPYLRTQAQPGFPLRLLPQVHAHVTRWLKGGGPLPALRLGRQPYGILPVQPRQPWASHEDDAFTAWLAGYLPRIRALWLAGREEAPSGLAAYTHEPVSSRFRVRTTNASSTRPFAAELGITNDGAEAGVQERRLVAELGLGAVLPMVVSSIFLRDAVDLWMPVSDEHDLDFMLASPNPKEATSVLGLLLRNAALQVTTNLVDEWLSPVEDAEIKGYAATFHPTFSLTALSGLAVSSTPEIALGAVPTLSDRLALSVVDEHGAETTVADRIDALVADHSPIGELGRYRHTEAFRTYRGAHEDLAAIPTDRRARLTGEVLDCASHRYDAWVTSLATKRLDQLRETKPTGLQLGAWGVVQDVRRRTLPTVDRDDLPDGTVTDAANRGFVIAPSLQHASVAGVLRAAWIAHGASGDVDAPFAVDLRSVRLRQALMLADGMRNGQQLGALLGYQLERALHDASGNGTEVDWAVFELRRSHPLTVSSAENTGPPSERLVVDGWRVVQDAMENTTAVVDDVMAHLPGGLDADSCRAAITEAVEDLVGSLDGLMDLGLAEAVHQLAGSNFARASAATDMIGRAAVPPDAFDVATTPRGGQGIDQRLVVVFAGEDRPSGYAITPRAQLATEADAFVARRLGDLTGITLRLLGEDGGQVATCALAELGLSALDLAADAASTGAAAPFPLVLARARAVSGHPEAASLALDPETDESLLDLLEHAARWHQVLAGRRPLSAATLQPRGMDLPGQDTPPDGGALAAVREKVEALAELTRIDEPVDPDDPVVLDLDELAWWGFDPTSTQAAVRAGLTRRIAEARAAGDAATAARALFGSDCVVSGSVSLGTAAPWTVDQDQLGVGRGDLVGWVQDTGRVRDAAHALDEALLHGELGEGAAETFLVAGQTPAVPGVVDPADPDSAATARRWVGRAFPGALGNQPVVSFVVVHDGDTAPGADPTQDVVGVEVDGWVEVVPDRAGAGAVAANLASPDSRAPNTILLAVPSDVDAPWTQESLFSVIDEALELADCRLVDLDASRRIPAVLPAIYISEYDDDLKWRELIHQRVDFPQRYVAKGAL